MTEAAGKGGRDATVRGGLLRVDDSEVFVLSMPTLTDRLPAGLTGAERAVAMLLLEGLSNREVAQRRGTSVRTVANQVASLFRKLGVNARTEMVGALVLPRERSGAARKPR